MSMWAGGSISLLAASAYGTKPDDRKASTP